MTVHQRIPIPYAEGEMVPVYIPKGDLYRGADTAHFTRNTYYDTWVPNDFSICKQGDTFHIIGITHPIVPGFVDGFCHEGNVHEGEFQLFHCTARGSCFQEVFRKNAFEEQEKILYPASRPGETNEIWAPQLLSCGEEFAVIYSPGAIRCKRTRDFEHWQETETLFTCENPSARDPMVYMENGLYHLLYTESRQLKMRTSPDLHTFSAPVVLQDCLFDGTENESPFLFRRKGYYYLLWSIYDGRNGSYDDRTLVFASETLTGLRRSAPLTMLRAHAPEVVTDPDGTTYLLSVFSPQNGICAGRLSWLE